MKIQDFKKYEEDGSYHWQKTQGSLLKWSPRLDTRYELAIDLVNKHKDIQMLKGLDLGCGDGLATYKIRNRGGYVVGLDGSVSGIRLAKQELSSRKLINDGLLAGNCYTLPFADKSFDYVISLELIEHLADVPLYLTEIERVLKPGGILVCSTPQRLEEQGESEVRDPYHEKEYSAQELYEVMTSAFKKVDVLGAFPDYLDKRYLRFTGVKFLDNVYKLLFKVYCRFVVNIYATKIEKNPDHNYRQLFARAEKAR